MVTRRAVIDIGTNSVKLLVADIEQERVDPVLEESEQTRLGQGFYADHIIQPDALARTVNAVDRLAANARDLGASAIRVIATSAARDAVNQAELVQAVQASSGLTLRVISGQQEADWVYSGVRSDPALANGALLIMDVGGGSAEFVLGHGPHPCFSQSFPIGTVRLLERVPAGDPPSDTDWGACRGWLEGFLVTRVKPCLEACRMQVPEPLALVGTGGTTSILASVEHRLTTFDRRRIEQTTFTRGEVWAYQRLFWSLSLSDRRKLTGLPPNRADVILYGAAVFAMVMEVLGIEQLRVSTRGLRFGALMHCGDIGIST